MKKKQKKEGEEEEKKGRKGAGWTQRGKIRPVCVKKIFTKRSETTKKRVRQKAMIWGAFPKKRGR